MAVTLSEEQLEELLSRSIDAALEKHNNNGTRRFVPSDDDIDPDPIPEEALPFKSFGEQLLAIMKSSRGDGYVDPRLGQVHRAMEKATGLSEGIAADGGFLLQPNYQAELLKRTYETGQIMSRCRQYSLAPQFSSMKINAITETSRVDGSRMGGVRAYWAAEAASKTASQPAFRQMTLEPHKLIGLVYATDELLQDVVMLEQMLAEMFTEEFAFAIEDAIINGNGAGRPLGLLAAPCLVSVAKETGQAATTIVQRNISKMWARMWGKSRPNAVWFINQDIEPQLDELAVPVGTGGSAVYLPAGGLNDSPYSRLKGRPVIPVEHCQTLGTQGDIILADMSQYILMDKGQMETAMSIHLKFDYDETAFRFVLRIDGQPWWASALTPAHGTNTLSPFVVLDTRS